MRIHKDRAGRSSGGAPGRKTPISAKRKAADFLKACEPGAKRWRFPTAIFDIRITANSADASSGSPPFLMWGGPVARLRGPARGLPIPDRS